MDRIFALKEFPQPPIMTPKLVINTVVERWYHLQNHCNTTHENKSWVDYDYQNGDKILMCIDNILCKS